MNRRDLLRGAGSAVFGHSSRRLRQLDKHRNLFTGDSCVYFYNPELWQPEGLPYTARAIHRYVDLLADSGVDTFLSNPNAQVAWYPSKRLETILDGYRRGDRDFFRAHARATHVPPEQLDAFLDNMVRFHNLYLDLAEAGVDWLAETVKACRRRQIAPWVSVRMNDTHGVEDAASHFNCKAFRDPANRLGGQAIDPADPPNAHWVALNYARKPVRDFMFSHIREYLENYGFEGLELDWLRDPHILEPGATEADCRLVTSWLKDVRAFADSRARITGKPLPLGLRIPANLGYLRNRGLDVQAIVRDGLVDFIGFSNFWQTSWDIPYEQLRAELGPDVVFHGVVEDAPNWIPGHAPDMASNTGQAPLSESRRPLHVRQRAHAARERRRQTLYGSARHRAVQFLLHRSGEDPRSARGLWRVARHSRSLRVARQGKALLPVIAIRPALHAVGNTGTDSSRDRTPEPPRIPPDDV
ncbi:MAG: hypothetical protein LC126_25215 [Bryobacterales bacterium]|nr:hypothetical protein [Bryobacterales bacterium]